MSSGANPEAVIASHVEANEHFTKGLMVTIVIEKDVAQQYKDIDDSPEPYYPEPMGNDGDDWVELTIDDEESTDFYVIANKYNININHIIAIGYEDENEEFQYKITNEKAE